MCRNVPDTNDRCNIANGSIGHTTRSYVTIFPFGRIFEPSPTHTGQTAEHLLQKAAPALLS